MERTEVGEGRPLVCRLCGRPVTANRRYYDVHESMHWLCFHIVFEHEGDPDEPCKDPSCPRWHEQLFRREIERLGRDPDEVLVEAMEERYGL